MKCERGMGQGSRVKGNVYVVVLIGGKGKRLRPLSTNAKPKAFLSVTRDRLTMFGRTVRRARRITSPGRIVAVANRAHLRLVRRDVPGFDRKNLLLEPVSRNTAPAIALAARTIAKRASGDAVIAVLPTDQYIVDEGRYVAAVKRGIAFVRGHGGELVVLGHTPSYPATQFGYIRTARRPPASGVCRVSRFVEKPGLAAARRYVRSGRYLWNTGAFIFRAGAALDLFKEHAPAIYRVLGPARRVSRASYARLPDVSFDYAIAEKARAIHCVAGSYRWQDMGTFESLRGVLRREGRAFVERGGKITRIL